MRMRLIPVVYFGFTAMDRRFSSPMLPWIFSEIRKREHQEKLSLAVEDGCLQAYNQDFEVQFSHKLGMMTRFSQADSDPCTFLYLLRDDGEQLLYCYLYASYKQSDVAELYQQMKEHQGAPRPPAAAANLTSLCVDISPSCSNFFEVLYIGKIKVWHKKVPETFIDDALDKFQQHDLEKNRKKLARLRSEMDLRRGSADSACSLPDAPIANGPPQLQRSYSLLSNLSVKSPDVDRKVPTCVERIAEGDGSEEREASTLEEEKKEQRSASGGRAALEGQLKAAASDDHNRTMVLQVDRTDLRLISPDRKVILLHKQHREVTTCVQGVAHARHFGFIAREAGGAGGAGAVATYIGFIFKCESAPVAGEAVAAIAQALSSPEGGARARAGGGVASCDRCPMVWYHRLCCEIEALAERKQQAAIMRRVEQLDDGEQALIVAKFRGAVTGSLRDQNEFLMMLLRAHCEMKQGRHQHDSAEQRSEFLSHYLGGGGGGGGGGNTIFMKAKRSLSISFDHLLKRRGSRDDLVVPAREGARELTTLPVHAHDAEEEEEGAQGGAGAGSERSLKSPMMDIFMKVGSSGGARAPSAPASWRQAIFKRVRTPLERRAPGHRYAREELRHLWRKSIRQAILLVRMERENARIRAEQEESAVKRIKLEYDEMASRPDGCDVWELLAAGGRPDDGALQHAVEQGVPRGKRGEVWHYLAEQFCARLPPVDAAECATYRTPYETLLKQLTSHQHAILIDLGRTFPGHAYYASPLGPGQLALFNLLKAYSLLDPEVGYCQGLSFVAGVLLLHMDEPSAFFLLRHLMYRRHLRQQYLPDMDGLQVRLYQLSRLLRDQLPEVYAHLDAHEVAPTLYAAPWLLTIFASQFPLGFVARVFDLILLEGADAVLRVILALLAQHQAAILACDSFEGIMDYFKHQLPQVDQPALLAAIMRRAHAMNIGAQLRVYHVEYTVLQEEAQAMQTQIDALQRAEAQLEQARAQHRSVVRQLETQNRSLEAAIATLGTYLNQLIEPQQHGGAPVPAEVRRILERLPAERPRDATRHIFSNLFSTHAAHAPARQSPDRPMVKSLSVGRITLPSERDGLNGNHSRTADVPHSPTNSIDSGLSTPVAHKDIIEECEEDSLNNNNRTDCHSGEKKVPPLTHSDLTVTFNHRELRKVKSVRDMVRNRSPSPSIVE